MKWLVLVLVAACGGGGDYLEVDGVRHGVARATAEMVAGRYLLHVSTTGEASCATGNLDCWEVNINVAAAGQQTCSTASNSPAIGLNRAATQQFTTSFGGSCTIQVAEATADSIVITGLDAMLHDGKTPRTVIHLSGVISSDP